jgi:predicted  nucleic acid-binding Zn-ribbon protein
MNLAKSLFHLQELDLKINDSMIRLNQLNKNLGDDRYLQKTQKQISNYKARLDDLRKKLHEEEWQIDDLSAKIIKGNETLFSGRIQNPKELSGLQREVDMWQKQKATSEDRAINVMEEIEVQVEILTPLESGLKQQIQRWRDEQRAILKKICELNEDLTILRNERASVLGGLDYPTTELYESLKQRKGQAVGRVEQGSCRACGITLAPVWLQRARGGELIRCGGCGRIIFVE